MSCRCESSFDEIRYKRPSANLRGARQYKLVEVGEPEIEGLGWKQSLGFISDIPDGGERTIVIRAKHTKKLEEMLGIIRSIEETEKLAEAQYRRGDLNRADFNREMGVRMREKAQKLGVTDLPEREWKWENNQLIYRGQQKMF